MTTKPQCHDRHRLNQSVVLCCRLDADHEGPHEVAGFRWFNGKLLGEPMLMEAPEKEREDSP